jgi:DNA-binding transcriptional LysR family regulator
MRIELRDLEYFSVICEHAHLGRAAESLNMSQSALSKSLRRLESAVGAKVVMRTPKGVELTDVGSALRAQVQRLRLTVDDVMHEAHDLAYGRAGHLRVGVTPGFVEYPLAPACRELMKNAPKLSLRVRVGTTELLSALRNGELDLLVTPILTSANDDVAHEHLFDDQFIVYGSARHRLARKKRIGMGELAHESWTLSAPTLASQTLERAFASNGLPAPRIVLATTSIILTRYAVANCGLLGYAPQRVLREGATGLHLVRLAVPELKWTRRGGIHYRKGGYLSPPARLLIDALKSITST